MDLNKLIKVYTSNNNDVKNFLCKSYKSFLQRKFNGTFNSQVITIDLTQTANLFK